MTSGIIALSLVPTQAIAADSDLKLDSSISVSGLAVGDTVRYYQIIEQNPTTKDWKFTTAVDHDQDGIIDGTKVDQQADSGLKIDSFVIKNTDSDPKNGKKINADMANAICKALTTNATKPIGDPITLDSDKFTVENTSEKPLAAGMYMVEASAGANSPGIVYKPVFVSTDYYKDGSDANKDSTDSIALVTNPTVGQAATDYAGGTNDAGEGVFKKSKLEIVKTSGTGSGTTDDKQRDVAVGDVVKFTINVAVPTYTQNYEHPFYMVTDRLSDGLVLCTEDGDTSNVDTSDIVVSLKDGETTWTLTNDQVSKIVKKINADKNKYTVVIGEDLLYTLKGAPTLEITYHAKVNSTALYQVNQMDNKTALTYSNDPNIPGPNPVDPQNPNNPNPNYPDPTDPYKPWDPTKPDDQTTKDDDPPTGTSTGQDRTRHYTFGIDANVLKPNNTSDPENTSTGTSDDKNKIETKELEKVGIEANGKVDGTTTKDNYPSGDSDSSTDGTQPFSPLAEATFQLHTAANTDASTAIKFKDKVKSNDTAASADVKSDADGSITMRGLDAGTYYLFETACPLGYTFDPSHYYRIVITPTYVNDPEGNEIISSYTVTTYDKDSTTALATNTYTVSKADGSGNTPNSLLNESGEPDVTDTTITLAQSARGGATIIANRKLGLLPATGGSGMLFYLFAGAGIMVIAVKLAKSKRRSERETLA